MKKILMVIVGVAVGFIFLQLPYRYEFLEIDRVNSFVMDIVSLSPRFDIETDVFFIGLISLPFCFVLGVALGLFLSFFSKNYQKLFICGFLVNFIFYFAAPLVNLDFVNTLMQASAAGAPKLRYYELLFSNFYSLVFIWLTIFGVEKTRAK